MRVREFVREGAFVELERRGGSGASGSSGCVAGSESEAGAASGVGGDIVRLIDATSADAEVGVAGGADRGDGIGGESDEYEDEALVLGWGVEPTSIDGDGGASERVRSTTVGLGLEPAVADVVVLGGSAEGPMIFDVAKSTKFLNESPRMPRMSVLGVEEMILILRFSNLVRVRMNRKPVSRFLLEKHFSWPAASRCFWVICAEKGAMTQKCPMNRKVLPANWESGLPHVRNKTSSALSGDVGTTLKWLMAKTLMWTPQKRHVQ